MARAAAPKSPVATSSSPAQSSQVEEAARVNRKRDRQRGREAMALSLSLARLSLALSPPLLQGSPAKKLPAPRRPRLPLQVLRLGRTVSLKFAAVAASCVQYEADFRPNMSIVVKALQPLLNARASNHGENAGS